MHVCGQTSIPPWSRWLPLTAWLALVVGAVACADEGWAPRVFALLNGVPGADKVGHFVLIGTLTWLLNRALLGRKVPLLLWKVQLGSLLIACLMTLEETSQIWISTRQFSLGDLAANYAGIACATLLTRWPQPSLNTEAAGETDRSCEIRGQFDRGGPTPTPPPAT